MKKFAASVDELRNKLTYINSRLTSWNQPEWVDLFNSVASKLINEGKNLSEGDVERLRKYIVEGINSKGSTASNAEMSLSKMLAQPITSGMSNPGKFMHLLVDKVNTELELKGHQAEEGVTKQAAVYDSKETDELMTKELADRDDYGEKGKGQSGNVYHDYPEDSNLVRPWSPSRHQQELWNRFREWWSDTFKAKKQKEHDEKRKVGKDKDEHAPQRGPQDGPEGEGFWAYKQTPYAGIVQSPAFFMAMPAMKIGAKDLEGLNLEALKEFFIEKVANEEWDHFKCVLDVNNGEGLNKKADEQNPEAQPEPKPEEAKAPEETEKKETPLEAPPEAKIEEPPVSYEEEEKQKIDIKTFWDGIDEQVSASVNSTIDTPEDFGRTSDFNGKIVFKGYPDFARSFNGSAQLIHGKHEGKPNVSLVLPITSILDAIASIVKAQASKRGAPPLAAVARLAQESLPIIFKHVFTAIKEKSPNLYWSRGDSTWYGEGKTPPLVKYQYDSGIDKELGVNLSGGISTAALNEQAEKILGSHGGSGRTKKDKVPELVRHEFHIKDFVNKLPEDLFKPEPNTGSMMAVMKLEDIEKQDKAAADIIKATPEIGAGKKREAGTLKDYWYQYNPDTNTVVIENRKLTDKRTKDQIKAIYNRFGGGTPQEFFRAIAGNRDVTPGAVAYWFTNLIGKIFDPTTKDSLFDFFKLKGLEKVAYPNQTWAGPTLEQIGRLVGDAQAKWASEWASDLAGKFDYISYPKLEGGPSELKKLATLPLEDEKVARVEKFRKEAIDMLGGILETYPVYERDSSGEVIALLKPQSEEVIRLAEDVLLNTVENNPSTMPDEEFAKELNSALHSAVKRVQSHPETGWPSTQTAPGDVLEKGYVPFDVVKETPEEEEEGLHKKAFHKEDAVQVVPNHPNVHPQFFNHIGKVEDVQVDIYLCPKHGPEALARYLVDFGEGHRGIFSEDELRGAGTTN